MAEGVALRLGAGASLAVTGVAGPTGGTPEKPVGTVWLAARLGDRTESTLRRFPGERDDIRRRSAQAALDLMRSILPG
jgi:nicotinamide-nucleotide amidase